MHMAVIFTNRSMEAKHPMTFDFPIRFSDAQKICISVFIRHWKISDPENSAIHFLMHWKENEVTHVLWPPGKTPLDHYIYILFVDFTSSSLDVCMITSVLVSFKASEASWEVSVSAITTVLSSLDANEHEGSFISSSTCSWPSALPESESALFPKQNQTSSIVFQAHQNSQAQYSNNKRILLEKCQCTLPFIHLAVDVWQSYPQDFAT